MIFFSAILWLTVSVILFTLPGAALPQENWFDKIWFDKLIHAAIFFVLVLLWFLAITGKTKYATDKRRSLIWVVLVALLYGIGIEFIQKHFIAGRSFDGGDIVADIIGCISGFAYCFGRYIKK